MATREWSRLPVDLLGAIINCLSIPDCLRVRVVCRSWSLAAAETPYRPTNPPSPWLVTAEGFNPDAYALLERRWYRLNLPEGSTRCVASSHGWLVFADKAAELHLLNPITGVRINLPSVATFSWIKSVMMSHDGRLAGYVFQTSGCIQVLDSLQMLYYYYKKIKVFSDHRHSGNIMVFVFRGMSQCVSPDRLSYAIAGDETWTDVADGDCFRDIADFTFHKGKLHGVFLDCKLVVVDNLTSSPLRNSMMMYSNTRMPNISTTYHQTFHLVDSADGEDLLLVLRGDDLYSSDPKSYFLVLKLDWEESEPGWVLVRKLEKTAIFLGENRSMALSTHDLPELKENCIYFTDLKSFSCGSGRDEGVFHLEDGSISPLFTYHDSLRSPLLQWFTPAL